MVAWCREEDGIGSGCGCLPGACGKKDMTTLNEFAHRQEVALPLRSSNRSEPYSQDWIL